MHRQGWTILIAFLFAIHRLLHLPIIFWSCQVNTVHKTTQSIIKQPTSNHSLFVGPLIMVKQSALSQGNKEWRTLWVVFYWSQRGIPPTSTCGGHFPAPSYLLCGMVTKESRKLSNIVQETMHDNPSPAEWDGDGDRAGLSDKSFEKAIAQ